MFNPVSSIRIFALLELLGLLFLVVGLVTAIGGPVGGEWLALPYGLATFFGALGMLATAHVGRCLVHIAATSTRILDRLDAKQ